MERTSPKLLAPALFGLLLLSSMDSVFGTRPAEKISSILASEVGEELPSKNLMKGVEDKLPSSQNMVKVVEEQLELLNIIKKSMQPNNGALQCVTQGSYCNILFGPTCCSTPLACVPPGIIGGVCVA